VWVLNRIALLSYQARNAVEEEAAGSNKINCQAVLEEQKFSVPVSLSVVI